MFLGTHAGKEWLNDGTQTERKEHSRAYVTFVYISIAHSCVGERLVVTDVTYVDSKARSLWSVICYTPLLLTIMLVEPIINLV